MECAQVTEEQRLWTETQIQKAKHNAWPSCLASVYLTITMVAIAIPPPISLADDGTEEEGGTSAKALSFPVWIRCHWPWR